MKIANFREYELYSFQILIHIINANVNAEEWNKLKNRDTTKHTENTHTHNTHREKLDRLKHLELLLISFYFSSLLNIMFFFWIGNSFFNFAGILCYVKFYLKLINYLQKKKKNKTLKETVWIIPLSFLIIN